MRRQKLFLILFLAVACTKQSSTSTTANSPAATPILADQVEAGRKVYTQYCITCHNPNPAEVGSVGPALKGSSLELLTARVLTANYPPNYKPQRATKVMPAFPYLQPNIADLNAFINN